MSRRGSGAVHSSGLALALTNAFGTTFGQPARGGGDHHLYLAFNLARRF